MNGATQSVLLEQLAGDVLELDRALARMARRLLHVRKALQILERGAE